MIFPVAVWQAVDELDSTRILVGGETIAHEGLNFACAS